MTSEAANVEPVASGDLSPHPKNPRSGDVPAIVESIEANGWYGTIVAQRSTGHVLAGNHRLLAAQQLGIETVPVYWADVDDDTALRILLADNRTTDLASYDEKVLADLLVEMGKTGNLDGTGYDGDDLDNLLAELDQEWRPDLDTTPVDLHGEYQLVIVCSTEQAQREALDDLQAQGYTVRASLL